MNITSAKYANSIGDSVEAQTSDRGSVLIALPPHSDNCVGGQEAFALFIANGGTVDPFIPAIPDPIAIAEAWVGKSFTSPQLIKMLQWVGAGKTSAKLTAVLTWEETISAQAIAGLTTFANPPFTFLEVATEVLG